MPTKLAFETALLADAVQKAARVAPNKGDAFDKAGGIFFDVNPATKQAVLTTTDLNITYRQTLTALEASGDATKWRIPSALFAGVCSGLPMNQDSITELIDRGDEAIRLKCDRVVAMFNMLDTDVFPRIKDFDVASLKPTADFADKVNQVAWACDDSSSVLSGVLIDGKRLAGANRGSLAVVPCDAPITEQVVVPLSTLSALLKQASDVRIGTMPDQKKFLIALDAETRATSQLLEGQFPKIDNVMRTDFTGQVQVNKTQFTEALGRMLNLIRTDKQPTLTMEINGLQLIKELIFDCQVPGVGRMRESIDIAGEYNENFSLNFVPGMVQKAVENAKSDLVTLSFGHENGKPNSIRVSDEGGYQCWTMPKVG